MVIDGSVGMTVEDEKIVERIKAKNIPYLIVKNKADLCETAETGENIISVSAATGQNIYELKERLGSLAPKEDESRKIVSDILQPNDFVVLKLLAKKTKKKKIKNKSKEIIYYARFF